ncbi:MAG TPA: ABC transporter permease [Dehalococcoidia bacterium]|nr:ABC transporter permease [Dehalococcoidia bacterium]
MATDELGILVARERQRPRWATWSREVWKFVRTKPLGAIGGFFVLALLIMAAFAPLIAPYHYDDQVYTETLQGPSLDHFFGTDDLGRDLFSRVVYGARISVIVGFGSVAIAMAFATLIGMLSGYYGGVIDTAAQRLVEIAQAFPALILLISIIAIIGQGTGQITLALGFLFAVGASRVIRGAVLGIKNNVYFEAARCVGASDVRIMLRYVLPNIAATIIVLATVYLGAIILVEASLSFLGYGIPPPYPSWGRMLNGIARSYIIDNPWMGLWPGLFISLAVFGFNMLGDALRDVLDPRLRGTS